MALRRLEKPELPAVKICLWEDLTFSGMDIIQKASTTEEIKQALHQLLSVSLDGTDPRAAILLDLYVYTLQFAKSHRFNKEQTSGFFSIVKRLHQACTGTPLGNVKECFDYFLELVLCNSVRLRLDLSLCYQGMPETPPAVEEEMPVVDQDEVPPEETEPQGEQAAAPGHELRQYIEAQLAEQVSELKTSIEGRIQAGEQQLNLKLAALEKSKGAKSPRAKKK
ncbi:coiled-coil domain-containing protein 189 isoform X2 [Heterodontus francisci]|uniref:coiled-coil domain-containing protein 189 isoform X2 n=1 Tax=Heterodontus francisci TaxID=7792 RepID=UPI00355B5F89